ncbi:MAG: type II toxin-antitoxin system RelE/ParE family toxin [Pseudomonadota bacterium]|jgi:plasmid stabilization system protein ParE
MQRTEFSHENRFDSFAPGRSQAAARKARTAIAKGMDFLRDFPFSRRKAVADNPFLRELVIPFGASGHVALFEIDDKDTVTILAIRHQREDDYR